MTAVTFDTLAYSENMQKAGFTREQADAMAKANSAAFKDMISTQQLATKQDIEEVRREIRDAKHDVLKWMVTGMVAQTALLVAIIAFLK